MAIFASRWSGHARGGYCRFGMSVESTSPSRPTAKQWVFGFEEGSAEMRGLLGGKGANLAEMTHVLGSARVPGGFTITTEACVEYMKTDGRFPEGLEEEIAQAVTRLEQDAGQQFGGGSDPLLLSVRSGAPVSMPGMLDTVLNLGLNAESVEALSEASGNPRFAWDSFRRLVQMYSDVVRGVPAESFEDELAKAREATGSAVDADLDRTLFGSSPSAFWPCSPSTRASPFPRTRGSSFGVPSRRCSVRGTTIVRSPTAASRGSRMSSAPRSPCSGWCSATVARTPAPGWPSRETRPPGPPSRRATSCSTPKGEDVVAGVRNTEDLADLARRMPEAHAELIDALKRLERHYRDMQDVEYTIEQGRLYILQTRNAKRPAQAAVRFASDAVDEGLLGRDEALATVEPGSLDALLHPTFDPEQTYTELTRAVPASPGGAKGAIVFTAEEAEQRAEAGDDVILVREFTSADDVGGFHAAKGVLTSRGGKSSHAAIVARGMGRPCVCGASELEIDLDAGVVRVGGTELHAGDTIAIDGSTGVVTADDVRLIEPKVGEDFAAVLSWADEIRRLGVRANADTAEDAARARELGAEGIGLCRTEHMFFGSDREELVRDMFIAGELWRRGREQGEAGSGVGKPTTLSRPRRSSPERWMDCARCREPTSSRSSER